MYTVEMVLAIIGGWCVLDTAGSFARWLNRDGLGIIGRWLVRRDEGRHRRGL